MLVLSRSENERIMIGDNVIITVVRIDAGSGRVKIGIEAPKDISVHREEVYQAKRREAIEEEIRQKAPE